MNLRNTLFWCADYLKGSSIKKKLSIIKESFNYNEMKFDVKKLNIDLQLQELLDFAVNNTKYYEGKQPRLHEFAILNKQIIRDNINSFLKIGLDKNTLISQVTSGSTGYPFTVYWGAFKKSQNTADTIFFNELAGYKVGQKLFYSKIWNEINNKSFFRRFAENVVQVDVRNSTPKFWSSLIKELTNLKKPAFILSYASALEELAKQCEKDEVFLQEKVGGVLTMSEALSDFARDKAQKRISKRTYARYSNMENGIIAQQTSVENSKFLINKRSYVVEIVDENSSKVLPNGEIGRIVITDLHNYSMPLIRYDTGDLGVKSICGDYLERIEGRKMDAVFDTSGNLLSSFIVTNMMWKYTELQQYQFIQTGKTSYLFKLNSVAKFEREKELIIEFQSYLGNDEKLLVEYVDDIP